MKIGKKIKFVPYGCNQEVTGQITSIDPRWRFVTVAYQLKTPFGKSKVLYESLPLRSDKTVMLD